MNLRIAGNNYKSHYKVIGVFLQLEKWRVKLTDSMELTSLTL